MTSNASGNLTIVGDTSYFGSPVQLMRFNKQLEFQSNVDLTHTYNSPVIARDGFVYNSNGYHSSITKLDENNQVLWTLTPTTGNFNINTISISDEDTIYVAGHFMGSGLSNDPVTLGGVSISAPDPGNNNHVGIFKLDTAGNVHEGIYLAQSQATSSLVQIRPDMQGNVYVAMAYGIGGQVIGTDTLSNPTGAGDAFVVKLDRHLSAQWLTEIHHSGGNMETRGLVVHPSGKVMLIGLYGSNATIGSYTLDVASFGSGFMAQMDHATGNILYATNFGALCGTGRPHGVVNINDKYYFTGLSYSSSLTGGKYGCYKQTFTSQYLTCFHDTVHQLNVSLQYSNPDLHALDNAQDAQYKWFLDNAELMGETGSSIVPDTSGLYMVEVTDKFGCTVTDTLTITIPFTGILESEKEQSLFVFPNPSDGKYQIRGLIANNFLVRVEVKNPVGTSVFSQGDFSPDQTIDIRSVAPGIYFVEILQNGKLTVLKVLKHN